MHIHWRKVPPDFPDLVLELLPLYCLPPICIVTTYRCCKMFSHLSRHHGGRSIGLSERSTLRPQLSISWHSLFAVSTQFRTFIRPLIYLIFYILCCSTSLLPVHHSYLYYLAFWHPDPFFKLWLIVVQHQSEQLLQFLFFVEQDMHAGFYIECFEALLLNSVLQGFRTVVWEDFTN